MKNIEFTSEEIKELKDMTRIFINEIQYKLDEVNPDNEFDMIKLEVLKSIRKKLRNH